MPETGSGDVAVQQGEVGRVEDRVAGPGRRGGQEQHGVARRGGENQARRTEQPHARHQHPPRAEAVDDEAGGRLAEAGDGEEHGREQARLGEAQAEVAHQPGEQRRDHQVEEMRDAVAEAYDGDGFDFAAFGGGCGAHDETGAGVMALWYGIVRGNGTGL